MEEGRVSYDNPTPEQLQPNMMLRVGKKSQPNRWQPAILTEVNGRVVKAIFYPGGTLEEERIIDSDMIRIAWTSPGVDFLSLCKKFSGAFFAQVPSLHRGHTVH